MGALTEEGLNELVAAGCGGCGEKKLAFRTYVDARFEVIGGEPVSGITWVYDGEKFVDGVFEAKCAACARVLFASDWCPRCNAAGALAGVLATENRLPAPAACPKCGDEDVFYVAMVPSRVAWEGGRAEKARAEAELHEPGFHGTRVDCGSCGIVAEVTAACPLCGTLGPLRARP